MNNEVLNFLLPPNPLSMYTWGMLVIAFSVCYVIGNALETAGLLSSKIAINVYLVGCIFFGGTLFVIGRSMEFF
jgi:hypothetical protein